MTPPPSLSLMLACLQREGRKGPKGREIDWHPAPRGMFQKEKIKRRIRTRRRWGAVLTVGVDPGLELLVVGMQCSDYIG